MPEPSRPKTSARQSAQALYVRILLCLLPALVNLFKHLSPNIRAELNYLTPGYTFMLRVDRTPLSCACRLSGARSLKRIPAASIARDVEPGSGLDGADKNAISIDYVISFRSLAYAFSCFSGSMTLKSALAQRAFSTRGPNDTGVALTYLFTALLKLFFGWRAAYRTPKRNAEAS